MRCPECSGEIQLDNTKQFGFCMFCGNKVYLEKTGGLDNSKKIENWLKLGNDACLAGNNKEGYEYFKKILEIEPDHVDALFLKGQAAAYQSTLANVRYEEFMLGINKSLNQIKNISTDEKFLEAKYLEYAISLGSFSQNLMQLANEFGKQIGYDTYSSDSIDQYFEYQKLCLHLVEEAIGVMDGNNHPQTHDNLVELKKLAAEIIRNLCEEKSYWMGYSETYRFYNSGQTKELLEKYDNYIFDIRLDYPNYHNANEYEAVNRLPGREMDEGSFSVTIDRRDENSRLQSQIDANIMQRIDKFKKEKYWKEHPEEYKEMLAKQKAKNEAQQKAKKLAEEKRTKIEQECLAIRNKYEKEIADLSTTYSKLGIFELSKKSEIKKKIEELKTIMATEINKIKID